MDHKKIISSFLFIILFAVLLLWFTRDLDSYSNYNYDEGGYLSVGNLYFNLYFINHDFFNPAWYQSYRSYGPANQVPKYIMGLSLYLFGYGDEKFEYFYFKWKDSLEENIKKGMVPSAKVLYAARFPIAVLGALTVLLIFVICRILCGWKFALIATLVTSFNHLILLLSKTAMLDIPYVFFSILTIFLMCYFLKRTNKKWSEWIVITLIGIIIGLAVSSKPMGIFILITTVIFFLILSISQKRKIFLFYLILILIITGSIFIISNPVLYPHPVKHSKMLITLLGNLEKEQEAYSFELVFNSFFQKAYYVTKNTLLTGSAPIYSVIKLPVDIIFFAIGFVSLLNEEFITFPKRQLTFKTLIIIWMIVTFLGTIYWIPIDRPRYYLPIIPCVMVIECYGLRKVSDLVKKSFRR